MYVTRRQFLKLSGAAGVGLYLASRELSLWALEPVTEVDNPLAYYPSRDWEKLYRAWQDLREASMAESLEFALKDEEFHETLAAWTKNQTLLQQIRTINERLHFIRMTDITSSERLQATCEQHLRILDCIKDKNIECAREALRLNIEDGRKNVEHAIKEALARAYLGSRAGA